MKKIPTAEEFFKQHNFENIPGYEVMIEFTKLHVEAALEEASNKVTADAYFEEWENGELKIKFDDNYEASYAFPIVSCGKAYTVDKESILNAYPLDKIV